MPEPTVPSSTGSLKARFDALHARRFNLMRTAYECARYTIPSLLPENPRNPSGSREFQQNYSKLGARGVNSLASKVMLAVFPTNTPFFKLTADEIIVQQIAALEAEMSRQQPQSQQGAGIKAGVDEKLSILETVIMNLLERQISRTKIFEAIKLLIVTGNALLRKLPGKRLKSYNLNSYVVRRDGESEVIEILIREFRAFNTLEPELQQLIQSAPPPPGSQGPVTPESELELYTGVERESADVYRTHQELAGVLVPGSEGKYKKDKLPYLVLRWNEVLDEDYGRGMIEDLLGDLRSLENSACTNDKITRACGKIVPMVNPNGLTRLADLNRAKDGEFVYGMANDVTFLAVEKLNDLSVVSNNARDITADLKAAFLMNSVVQRQGERVTAEEIRTVAAELEETLGGVYSMLSQDFQLPLVRLLYEEAKKEFDRLGVSKDLELDKELKISITAGLDAIGRGNDAQKLRALIAFVAESRSQTLMQYLNEADLLKRFGAALGVDMKGLVKTAEQMAAERQAAQQAELLQSVGAEGAKAAPALIANSLQNPEANQ